MFTQGWECPSCNRCYSPAVTECSHCPARGVDTTGEMVPDWTAKYACHDCGDHGRQLAAMRATKKAKSELFPA